MVTQDRRATLVGHARSFWPTFSREVASEARARGRATRGPARKDCVTCPDDEVTMSRQAEQRQMPGSISKSTRIRANVCLQTPQQVPSGIQ